MAVVLTAAALLLGEPTPLPDYWTAMHQEPTPIPDGYQWDWPEPQKEVMPSEPDRNPSEPVGPVATPPPANGVEQWRGLVAAYFPPEAVDRMLRIMACESGGDPGAHNPSGASGLLQIMPFWQKAWPGDYFDPSTNVAVAYQIWLQQGYGAWVCKG